jgi:hypothetical protein
MTIEQGQQLRVLWQAKGSPVCRHPQVEIEYSRMGEPTGVVVCSRCGDYLRGEMEDLMGTGEIG